MQLRVARLCLDCEEVCVGDVCPVCASKQTAYLTTWLRVEERRKWRRPAPAAATAMERRWLTVRQFFSNVFGDGSPVKLPGPPRTRRVDTMSPAGFTTPKGQHDATRPAPERQPAHTTAERTAVPGSSKP